MVAGKAVRQFFGLVHYFASSVFTGLLSFEWSEISILSKLFTGFYFLYEWKKTKVNKKCRFC